MYTCHGFRLSKGNSCLDDIAKSTEWGSGEGVDAACPAEFRMKAGFRIRLSAKELTHETCIVVSRCVVC